MIIAQLDLGNMYYNCQQQQQQQLRTTGNNFCQMRCMGTQTFAKLVGGGGRGRGDQRRLARLALFACNYNKAQELRRAQKEKNII